ncbi:hypothetical protein SAMN05216559_3123 [Halomicrobium zhouii]|uniref:DUF8048 domain-containing protein n=1 Tax=Halomicrobium zhouii TaxID=767519 RepID=A0A1I6LU19_9EURY|nr:hypothetical protein [Halomicrobium zhouii]SFS06925.1 hypothetical protein SAMN05216559_3123 [Halomicrobium zhouii]
MTTPGEDSDLFDADVLGVAARTHDVSESDLSDAVTRHQESVEALPGVENLAYEWRRQCESPLIERTPDAYYLAVPDHVWDEFGDALGLEDAMLDAVRDVHRRTADDRTDAPREPPGRQAYVVLDRSVGDGAADEG